MQINHLLFSSMAYFLHYPLLGASASPRPLLFMRVYVMKKNSYPNLNYVFEAVTEAKVLFFISVYTKRKFTLNKRKV
jgi:hypothetical protein